MHEINFDLKDIVKLLSNLKPDKATGQGEIKSIFSKELKLHQ